MLDRDDLDLYGEHVALDLPHRLRDTLRFDGVDQLLVQMAADVERTRSLLGDLTRGSRSRRPRADVGRRPRAPHRALVRPAGAAAAGGSSDAARLSPTRSLVTGAPAMLVWAVKHVFERLSDVFRLATRALPLLLLFMTFLFINTEVWQVAGGLTGPDPLGVGRLLRADRRGLPVRTPA